MKKGFAIIVILALLFSCISVMAQDSDEMTQEEMMAALASDPEMQAFLDENPEMMTALEDATTPEDMQALMFQYGMEQMKDDFNSNRDDVPGIVLTLFGNEQVNIYLEDQLIAGISMEDGYIEEIDPNGLEDPSLEIHMTQEFMEDLNMGTTNFEAALDSEDLQFNGVGFFNKIKFGFLKLFMNVMT